MRKIFFALVFTFTFLLNAPAFATDVWIDSQDDVECYIMSDTIENGYENGKQTVYVVTKTLRNGSSIGNTRWTFIRTNSSWRYYVPDPRNRTGRLEPVIDGRPAKILSYCLRYLGM